ncbi:MAG: ABC transporter ATP-binding protein [Oscillospiraceae bacterium]|jgi:ATP-binding cassette subfamily B multidrug efflux pump|nr:ABC transporter ATP-binding protein [Oscillospiraceae bacterium]
MKLFRRREEDLADIHYEGKVVPRMLSYLKPHVKTIAICLLLVLVLTALELYRPMLTGDAIDLFIAGDYAPGEAVEERFAGLLFTAGKYALALLITFVCNNRMMYLLQRMGQRIVYEMRRELFEHIESLSMRFFDLTPVGKIVTRVTNDVEAVHELYANILVKLFRNVVKILGLAVVMLALDVRMALLSFIMVPLVSVLTVLTRTLSLRANREMRTRLTALNTFLSEHLSGMKIIQIFNREKRKYEEFSQYSEAHYRASFRAIMVNAVFRPIIVFTAVVAMSIVIAGGSHGVLTGTVSFGTMYIFLQYIKTFFEPIQDLAEQLSTLQSAVASAEKIFTLLDEKPLIHDPEKPVQPAEIRGRIEFRNVWFAYDNENFILRDVSFVIEPGQKVAFVGATGAGKSSILNLIGRYYDIQKGEILIDGVNIKDLSRDQIRRAIGQVQQDVFIFTGDVKSNIRLREESISDEAIREASRQVNADRFIDRLPGGYDERVTERGSTFSAGQRQLLSFARTLAFDPSILILDEATANIDTETEQWIQEALETLMTGRTTIMVAHRLSTIQHADKIIVMHKGKIRESGTHQELLDQDGIYRKLYQLQLA